MDQKKRMLSGKLYKVEGKALYEAHRKAKNLLDDFNGLRFEDWDRQGSILEDLFAAYGKRNMIVPPFQCDYGENIRIGDDFFANYNTIMLDVNTITIGNRVMFGPRVSLLTAAHPIDKGIRAELLEYGLAITIEDDVWLGGNVTVNPGVRIGEGSIIGSGSVVTKDVPKNVVAAGNPCKVLREITDKDRSYWQNLKDEYLGEMKE